MFKQIFEAIKSFFASIFGTKKKQETPRPPAPQPVTTENAIPQDASEIKPDSVVVVANEMEFVAVLPDQPDEEFEKDTLDNINVEDTPPATPTPPAPDVAPPTPSAEHKGRYLWCLDNGHGSQTPGKRSPQLDDSGKRLLEYEFNRDIVRRIALELDKEKVEYFITVPEVDIDDFLQGRVDRANNKTSVLPKLFVSVHANAGPAANVNSYTQDSISGIEVWFYHGSMRGQKLASIFQKYLVEATGFKNRHIKSKPEGQFFVLRKTKMTSVLTENGFYNNRTEVKELMKDEVRQKIADAHVKAILEVERTGL